MASIQKLYLHAAAHGHPGTFPGLATQSTADSTPTFSAANSGTNRSMDGSIGVAQANLLTGTPSFGSGVVTNVFMGRWVSPLLDAATFGSGTWNISGAALETNLNINQNFMGGVLYLWRPSTGARIGYVFDLPNNGATEPGTTQTAINTNQAGANVTALAGDVLILEIWCDGTPSMTASADVQLFYDGTTEASTTSCATFLNAPAAISFQDPVVPSGPPRPRRRRAWQQLMRMAGGEACERRKSGILVPRLWVPADVGGTVR